MNGENNKTAPRMTDEVVAGLWGKHSKHGDEAALKFDHLRARSVESAALARVRRLEEALREFEGAFTDLDPDNQATRNRMRRALIQARAALSEET